MNAKSPEFYQKKSKKRENLKEFLPLDSRLEGSFKKTKWSFETPLRTKMNWNSPSYEAFFKKLESHDSEIDGVFDQELLDKIEKEKKEVAENFQGISLYLEGSENEDLVIKSATVSNLETLSSIDKQLVKTLIEKNFETMFNDPDTKDWNVLMKKFPVLATIDPELFASLVRKDFETGSWYRINRGAHSLPELVKINKDLAISLFEKAIEMENSHRRGQFLFKFFPELAQVDPEKFIELFKNRIESDDYESRYSAMKYLPELITIDIELYKTIYEKALTGSFEDNEGKYSLAIGSAIESLNRLSLINPDLYKELYNKTESICEPMKFGTTNIIGTEKAVYLGRSLSSIASVDQEFYLQKINERLDSRKLNDYLFIINEACSLPIIASIDPNLFQDLMKQGFNHEDQSVRRCAKDAVNDLAEINPGLYEELIAGSLNEQHTYEIPKNFSKLAQINQDLFYKVLERKSVESSHEVFLALYDINPELFKQFVIKNISSYKIRDALREPNFVNSLKQELFVEIYKEGISCRDEYTKRGYAELINKYSFNTQNMVFNSTNSIINRKVAEQERIFAYEVLPDVVNQDSPEKIWEYMDALSKTRESITEINNGLDETKRVNDVGRWFSDHQGGLAKVAKIFEPRDFAAFTYNLSKDTLLYSESFLKVTQPVFDSEEMILTLKDYFLKNKIHQSEAEKLLETLSQFVKAGMSKEAGEILKDSKDPQEGLDKHLVKIVANQVGIDGSDLDSKSMDNWNKEYISYLSSNNSIIEGRIKAGESNYDKVQNLYKSIVYHGFKGDFKKFIIDQSSGDSVGKDISKHNEQVFNSLAKLGVNTENWFNYPKSDDFLVSKEVKVNNTEQYKKVLQERVQTLTAIFHDALQDTLTKRDYEPITHLLWGAKSKGIKDITNYDELKEKFSILKNRIIEAYKKYPDLRLPMVSSNEGLIYEHLGHLEEAIELFQSEKILGTETKETGFRIKTWDRNPGHDLFQGNYTHCCIAVGVKDAPQAGGLYTHDPATVAQFLADAGMQVVEIYDQNKKNPIANTWLFVSKDSNGEPILVLDNVEVYNQYVKDTHTNGIIREELFKYVTQFAKDCNIPKVGIGRVGTNDVEWQSLPEMITAPVEKVGGYLSNYVSRSGSRPGRYYLEAYNSQTLGEIYNAEKTISNETRLINEEKTFLNSGLLQVIDLSSGNSEAYTNNESGLNNMLANNPGLSMESVMQNISAIENASFGDMGQSTEQILATLSSSRGMGFLYENDGKIVGYLSARSADSFNPVVQHASYDNSNTALYVESIAGNVDTYQTLRSLKEAARERGYTKIIMHGINPRLNRALNRFGFQTIEEVPNWLGKTAEYMEMSITE